MNKYQTMLLLVVKISIAVFSGCTAQKPDLGVEDVEYFSREYEATNNTTFNVINVNVEIDIDIPDDNNSSTH
ncbi:MAG: hypothetical protein ACQESU_09770 [Halobacteriota archaeon]